MKNKTFVAILVVGILLLAACDTAKKNAAEAAIQGATAAYGVVADQAAQYVPDQAKDVQASIQAAKDAYAKKDYSGALEAARNLPEQIKALRDAASAKKDELTAKLTELSSAFPQLLAAVQSREDSLKKAHKLPSGAADNLASVRQVWSDASTAFQSGKLQDAMAKATIAKEKLAELEAKLGMKPLA